MRKHQRKMIEDLVETLFEAHDETKKLVKKDRLGASMDLLGQCQEVAIKVGTAIENAEGEDFPAIGIIEEYCEVVFHAYEEVRQQEETGQAAAFDKLYKALNKKLVQVRNSIKNDIETRIEAVFLPYKASMWDSMETVWQAADVDEGCDAYVIPIPYYDKNADGTFRAEHWEKDKYPDYVPVTDYREYDFEARKPDMVFIHNPYDEYNTVTSVHPFYYSSNLKQYTDKLVYIPYYSTAGSMSEGQANLPSYYNVDYIIIQAEKYKKFFAEEIPQEKLVPLGSPKFDGVVKACQNPPEIPEAWRSKMEGKKVYFYNVSLGGVLGNTKAVLKKMEYVFSCFEGRDDVCLLWRPHPLLDSTFESMRPEEKSEFDRIKQEYLDKDFGIYDDTPDMLKTIALCDAYIGDSMTSVTSLFGIVGKPMFILNNNIHSAPEGDDWKGHIIKQFMGWYADKWMLTQGNKLYHAPNRDYHYEHYCDLNDYAYGDYYLLPLEINGDVYLPPRNAQDMLILREGKIHKRVKFEHCIEKRDAFYSVLLCDNYLFMIPNNYPAIVRYDIANGDIGYVTENLDVFIAWVDGEKRLGGLTVQAGWIYLASPADDRVLAIYGATGEAQVVRTGSSMGGCMSILPDGTDLWMLPIEGTAITRWNPVSGQMREYTDIPEGLECLRLPQKDRQGERPFNTMLFHGEYAYLSPMWANMYVKLHLKTGEMTEWIPPFPQPDEPANGYFTHWAKGQFLWGAKDPEGNVFSVFSCFDRKLYDVNLVTGAYEELKVIFDDAELWEHEPGFREESDWMQYCCMENPFSTLTAFLDDDLPGDAFDRERQIEAFGRINAVQDGTSGEKIYEFVRKAL